MKRVTNDVSKRFPKVPGQCRYCRKPLANKRLSWCGGWTVPNGCFTKAQQEGSWSHMRQAAWKRSGGKCEICGFDIAGMMKAIRIYFDNARSQDPNNSYVDAENLTKKFIALVYGIHARAWPNDCWAADHIEPIVEGGAHIPGLDGIRVACAPCHDRVTAELRKRLSARRKRHRWMPVYQKP